MPRHGGVYVQTGPSSPLLDYAMFVRHPFRRIEPDDCRPTAFFQHIALYWLAVVRAGEGSWLIRADCQTGKDCRCWP